MLSATRRRARNFAIALLLLVLAAWVVPSYFSAERYRRRLQSGLERVLHRPVRFGALSFHLVPRPGFSIENAEVGEDSDFGREPFVRVETIDCELRWDSLWRSRMDFAYLHLDHPSFNVVVNSNGEWNITKLLVQSGVTAPAKQSATDKAASAMEPLNLKVDDARINFQVGPNKKPFAFTDVRARLQVDPVQRNVRFQVTASPVRSDLSIPTPGPIEARGTWSPGGDLRGPLDVKMNTRGALLYDWIPVLTGKNPQLYGVMDSDVHLTGSLPDLTVEGETHLTQLERWEELPPSDPMPWTFRYRARLMRANERLQIENLEASFADSHLHLSGTVDKVLSDPQLDLVVSLEHSRMEDLLAGLRRLWPNAGTWNVKGRIDAMLALQGPWNERRYGGFVGAQEVSMETASRSFPLSDIAVRIDNNGAILSPVQITLAPRVALSAQGAIDRTGPSPRYDLQLAARNVPVRDAVAFGRGLGIHAFQEIDATGQATGDIHFDGDVWPLARPAVNAHAELRASRLLIPGLTEPINLPRATLLINDDQIVVDQAIAVVGTSVFKGKVMHQGPRANPWKFDLQANSLRLEQAALWFTALGLRRPPALLESIPGLGSFAARRDAASQIFGSLHAQGQFSTPVLSYRGVKLTDFQGAFEVSGRTIRMNTAKFRVLGGTGTADGSVDFTNSPPVLEARASLAAVPAQSLVALLPGSIHIGKGTVSAVGNFQTSGWAREELSENLTGDWALHLKDLAFADFDPLGSLVQQAHWGRLEPARGPWALPAAAVNLEVLDRHAAVKIPALDLSGGNLQLNGTYQWDGTVDFSVRADLRHLRRRWLERDDDFPPSPGSAEAHFGGSLDHLVVNPQSAVVRAGGAAGAFGVR